MKFRMRIILVFALYLIAVAALPRHPQRIIGGSVTTISQYPSIVALLYSWNSITFWQTCAGTILNNRSILTAAHCPAGDALTRWRVRLGSTFADSGGIIQNVASIVIHTGYDGRTYENDIGIMRTTNVFSHNVNVMPAAIASTNVVIADNQEVWAVGWGFTSGGSSPSEQLHHVQIRTINQAECSQRYDTVDETISENMLCTGLLDVGDRGWCKGDDGSPLFRNGVVVGIYSWGRGCTDPFFPSVNVRVTRYTVWIHANA